MVPSDSPSGPIKGAYAIVNELAKRNLASVSLIFLKSGPGANQPLDSRVMTHCLNMDKVGLFRACKEYRGLLRQSVGQKIVSLSMCFSADFINAFMSGVASTYSSIRGNLVVNYKRDYGRIGPLLALFHFIICRRFKKVFVLSDAMRYQVSKFISGEPLIQRNFVDETPLDVYRTAGVSSTELRVGFLGSLSKRKRPLLLVDLLGDLVEQGHDVCLDIVGSGPLKSELELYATKSGLLQKCTLHGFMKQPFKVLNNCDVLVLPSESEGTSRAVMEALYLGIPCVVFDVDGMEELITKNRNGVVIQSAEELSKAVLKARDLSTGYVDLPKPCLLPDLFRQETVINSMLEIFYE